MSVFNTIYTGVINVDNVNIDGNVVSSTDTNGSIFLTPDGSGQVVLKANPTSALGASTKQYVDAVATGLAFKAPTRVATEAPLDTYTVSGSGVGATLTATTNITINGSGIDGVTSLLVNDRILVKSEGTTSDIHNGLYDLTQVGVNGVSPWILTRATDFDQDAEVVSGTYVLVTEGTVNTDLSYVVSTNDPITIDTTAIVFVRFAPVTGESNTASNVGAGGVGIFKQKNSEDLEFKNINSTSAHITIVDDTGASEVDLTFIQTAITGTGALVTGSITSGFGAIDIGSSALSAGITTVTQLDADNLRLDANTLSSTDANGDINILPNGTGEVLLKANPTSALGATTKQYVDGVASGLDVKEAVRVTTDIALTAYTYNNGTAGVGATLTAAANADINDVGIDGVTDLVATERILVRSNGSAADTDNGIYTLTQVGSVGLPWILTRATDFDEAADIDVGAYTLVTEGTVYEGSSWTVNAAVTTMGTDPITFSQFSSPAAGTTASNVGAGGVGIFKQKTGSNLEFRNINSTTAAITVALDAVNNEVDLTFDQSQITGTGNIVGGTIASGFGTISTANTITTTALITGGSLAVDEVAINDGIITYTGTTGNNKIVIPTTLANAFIITDNAVDYIQAVSTGGGSQLVKLLQNTTVTGTLTSTGTVNGRNMGTDGTTLDNIAATGVADLTVDEVNQLENINSVTIKNTQWGYLGASDQGISMTDTPTFAQLTVDQFSVNDSTLTFTGADTANVITVPDNRADAFRITDGTQNYIQIVSSNGADQVKILQDLDVTGNLIVSGNVKALELDTTGAAVIISGAAPPTADQVLTALTPTTASWQDPAVYGSEYQNAISDGSSSTTSITYIDPTNRKLRMTTGTLPSGVYRIGWTYSCQSNHPSGGEQRIQINDGTTIMLSNGPDSSTIGYVQSGGFYYTGTISGVQTIDFDWRAIGGTSSIKECRMEIWRIS